MPSAANRFAAARPIPLAPPVITAVRPSANAGCCGMPLLLLPARGVEVNRHVFALRLTPDIVSCLTLHEGLKVSPNARKRSPLTQAPAIENSSMTDSTCTTRIGYLAR